MTSAWLRLSSRTLTLWRRSRSLAAIGACFVRCTSTPRRTTAEIIDRIHQYCRCIDGLILPDARKTKRQPSTAAASVIPPDAHREM